MRNHLIAQTIHKNILTPERKKKREGMNIANNTKDHGHNTGSPDPAHGFYKEYD